MASTHDDTIAELRRVNAELRRDISERDAALARRDRDYDERIAQQAATIDVLKAMSASPGDPQPVFDLIVQRARAFCNSEDSNLTLLEDGRLHLHAFSPRSEDWARHYGRAFPRVADRSSTMGRAVLAGAPVEITDVAADREFGLQQLAARNRSILAVPLLRAGEPIGALALGRLEPGAFTATQKELLQTFAAQAVIAITSAETWRALQTRTADLQESLEYQTATSDVLSIISRSTVDAQPVLDKLVETAARLCDAEMAMITRCDDKVMWLGANHGYPTELWAYWMAQGPYPLDPTSVTVGMRTLTEGRVVHVHDVSAVPDYPVPHIALGGLRTILGVPLRNNGKTVGHIGLARGRVEPFTDRQVALLENFATQAVIAMENARLLTEQREALEQQTATAEVLGVINASPGDLAPVFQTMLDRALRLCGAAFGELVRMDGEISTTVAIAGMPAAFSQVRVSRQARPGPGTTPWRLRHGENLVHIADLVDTEAYRDGDPLRRALVDDGSARALLSVPLRKDDALLGLISIYRQEPGPFTAKQIALLENFAAQAVIAMENARLLTEQREALEQQTAMAEVLRIIAGSAGDLRPVFDAILSAVLRLSDSAFGGLGTYDGELLHIETTHGVEASVSTLKPEPGTMAHRILVGGEDIVWLPDIRDDEAYRAGVPARVRAADVLGARTQLMAALRKEGKAIGLINIFRTEVKPFTETQIALVRAFADQAVIAMENARLLTEQREALEQQTAIAAVLRVINENPGNLVPVFEAILERAMYLCDAAFGGLWTFDDDSYVATALRGVPDAYAAFVKENTEQPGPGSAPYRFLHGERSVLQNIDLADEELYRVGNPQRRALVDVGGARTALHVPLCTDEAVLGSITLYRKEVRPFSTQHAELLQNFAAQAVIAMENARLLSEQREALERQTATAEVLQVINANPGDLTPVFEAMLQKALHLCNSAYGQLNLYDGEYFSTVSVRGEPALAEYMRSRGPSRPADRTSMHRIILGENLVHILDVVADEAYGNGNANRRALVELGGMRTLLSIALRMDEVLLGAISIYRQEVRAFNEKEIALLQNFAAQAVIAMENARLLTEQREALERQTATAEILQTINTNPGNLAPVFDAMLEKAALLCDAQCGSFFMIDGDTVQAVVTRGLPAEYHAELATKEAVGPLSGVARVASGEDVVHLPDMRLGRSYLAGEPFTVRTADVFGMRTWLGVPLRKDGVALGLLAVARFEVRPFTDRQIDLLKSFAAQAVIAMDNARLLNEIRQRQIELNITFENMGDGVAMFDREQKLAAWNRNFQDVLDLPDDSVRVGLTFADYIRSLATRGEYGPDADANEQIARLTALLDHANRFERTRPNGRVIDIRQNPIPGGGFVIIYADITERKRAEEALRTARDAAEQALRDLKLAQANLVQAEKMASLGQLTAGIAHEIKNPLNFVNNFAELSVDLLGELKQAVAPVETALNADQRDEVNDVVATLTGNLQKIAEHGKRADSIVRSMLEHSRGASAERRTADINALADEALNLAYHGARAQDQSFNITLERDFGDGIAPVDLNPQDITRVLLNLFSNGFYAANKRAQSVADDTFTPTLKLTTRAVGDAAEIRVRDNGIGIPRDIRDKLFQPFFTTKPTGEGTGLGLSITYDIVTKAHGGTISVASEVDEFTEFVVTLPRRMFASGGSPG